MERVDERHPRFLPDPAGPVMNAEGSERFVRNPAYDPYRVLALKTACLGFLPVDVLLLPVYAVETVTEERRARTAPPAPSVGSGRIDGDLLILVVRILGALSS